MIVILDPSVHILLGSELFKVEVEISGESMCSEILRIPLGTFSDHTEMAALGITSMDHKTGTKTCMNAPEIVTTATGPTVVEIGPIYFRNPSSNSPGPQSSSGETPTSVEFSLDGLRTLSIPINDGNSLFVSISHSDERGHQSRFVGRSKNGSVTCFTRHDVPLIVTLRGNTGVEMATRRICPSNILQKNIGSEDDIESSIVVMTDAQGNDCPLLEVMPRKFNALSTEATLLPSLVESDMAQRFILSSPSHLATNDLRMLAVKKTTGEIVASGSKELVLSGAQMSEDGIVVRVFANDPRAVIQSFKNRGIVSLNLAVIAAPAHNTPFIIPGRDAEVYRVHVNLPPIQRQFSAQNIFGNQIAVGPVIISFNETEGLVARDTRDGRTRRLIMSD